MGGIRGTHGLSHAPQSGYGRAKAAACGRAAVVAVAKPLHTTSTDGFGSMDSVLKSQRVAGSFIAVRRFGIKKLLI